MKQTKKMVVAAAAAVGAVAGGVVALANVPVGAAPEPTAQAVVASSMPSLRVCTRWPAVTRDAGRGPTPR